MEDKDIFNKWEEFKSLLKSTNRPNIDRLIKWLDESDFKFAPASTQYHNSFKGGLLAHSLNVYYHMYDFANLIQFFEIPQDSIIITALLHDICKVNCYQTSYRNVKNEAGEWTKVPFYTFDEQEPLGHAAKSIMLINEYGVELTKIERAMILNHMGFSEEADDKRRISKCFSKCPQCLLLHFADMLTTYTSESDDLQQRYVEKFIGRNISESLQKLSQPQEIVVNNTKYVLAPQNAEVDNQKIILMNYQDKQVKVYAPHGDGLPF